MLTASESRAIETAPDASPTRTPEADETARSGYRGQIPAAEPVSFGLCAARYMPARAAEETARSPAVLLVAPWGLEELSTRKFFRLLADRLAATGIASLRFDFPGTGNSLDPEPASEGLDLWRESICEAARHLRERGHDEIILIGQGLGASLALQASASLEGLAAMALLAPVVSGRSYLRELSVWAKVVDDGLNLETSERRPAEQTAIAGLVMPAAAAKELSRLKLSTINEIGKVPYLLFERPGQLGNDELAERLETAQTSLQRDPFAGYDALIAGPMSSRIGESDIETLVGWVSKQTSEYEKSTQIRVLSGFPRAETELRTPVFCETGVSFGNHHRLAGVLCEPLADPAEVCVLLFGSAYDRHSGWGRLATLTARRLAAAGIASLRFDCANVGDSPPAEGAPAQVLYATSQLDDAQAALTFLDARIGRPVVGVGRCSGAYLAFRTGLVDDRLKSLVLVNPYAFVWDERYPLDGTMRALPQSLASYRRKLLNPAIIGRALRGEMDVAQSLKNLLGKVAERAEQQLASAIGFSLLRRQEQRQVRDGFKQYQASGRRLSLVYSRGDVGTDHLTYHFGPDGERLAGLGNVTVTFIEGADHNLTPQAARDIYFDTILARARDLENAKHFR
ncbi:alpha/beta fold hydrolase [Rhizobium sp. SSA_523]|nr:alpha/beta fold hydrolase [Rhizobium sp. SSA_523]MCO5732488.1 alpha/beta fold hydrolase [Rhizobium sp. SSA_523]